MGSHEGGSAGSHDDGRKGSHDDGRKGNLASKRALRFGIIGTGLMGREITSAFSRWCHLTGQAVEPRVVAVCGRTDSHFDWFRENLPRGTRFTTDYRELLANPSVDAVYAAVPHVLHESIYIDTLRAGKHLLGEKPFGIDMAANSRILEEAAAHPALVVRCTSQFPYFPGAQRVVRLARGGAFGTVLEVEVGFLHSSDLDPRKPLNWKRTTAQNGAYGCMGDLGMHALHIPLRLGWAPANVRAILQNVVPERPDAAGTLVPCDTWDNATLLCEVPAAGSTFPLTVKTQRIAPGELNTWYISVKGTHASVRFSTKNPKLLSSMTYEPGATQGWVHEDLGYAPLYPAISGPIFEFGFTDAIQQMLAAYCEQVARGPNVELPFGCATLRETQAHHAILTAALESHASRRAVELLH